MFAMKRSISTSLNKSRAVIAHLHYLSPTLRTNHVDQKKILLYVSPTHFQYARDGRYLRVDIDGKVFLRMSLLTDLDLKTFLTKHRTKTLHSTKWIRH